MAQIEFWEDCTITQYSSHDVDPQKFLDWLDGDEINQYNLEDYLRNYWDPYRQSDEFQEVTNSGFSNEDEVTKFLNEVQKLKTNAQLV